MLRERVLTAAVGGTIFLILVYLGRIYALFLSLVLLVAGIYETTSMSGFNPQEKFLSIILIVVAFYFMINSAPLYALLVLLPVLTFGRLEANKKLLVLFFMFYITFALSLLFVYARPPHTLFPIIYLLAVTWSNDTIAYFAGLSFGRHKLAARISPGKTVEGTVAGILGGTLIFYLFIIFTEKGANPWNTLIIGLLLSTAAVLGDLFESYFKRRFGVKDSGKILPGHGGILDRFDSLMMVLIVFTLVKRIGDF